MVRMTRRGSLSASAVGLLILAGLVGACGNGGASTASEGTAARPAAQPAGGGDASGAKGGSSFEVPVAAIGPKIVKSSTIRVEVPAGTFDERFQGAVQIAARHGGFVASSQTDRARHPSGTVVLRVPADQFEATLGELKGLGSVTSERVSGEDVTAQYVDLQARLRNWEAQETVLLDLMSKATSIDESIKVQRSLQDVQLQIEELRGQLRVVDDQTSYATITASLAEAGAPVPTRPPSTLGKAWDAARDGFLSVVAAVVVGLGYLGPFGLAGLIGTVVWRVLRRRERRPEAAPEPSG
jgi:hypothetical protein